MAGMNEQEETLLRSAMVEVYNYAQTGEKLDRAIQAGLKVIANCRKTTTRAPEPIPAKEPEERTRKIMWVPEE
jgi:hypothetical protein